MLTMSSKSDGAVSLFCISSEIGGVHQAFPLSVGIDRASMESLPSLLEDEPK